MRAPSHPPPTSAGLTIARPILKQLGGGGGGYGNTFGWINRAWATNVIAGRIGRLGDWSVLKGALEPWSPYERGVFDRTPTIVREVGDGGVPRRATYPTPSLPRPQPVPTAPKPRVILKGPVSVPSAPVEEDSEVAHDWGHAARQIATGFFGGSQVIGPVYDPQSFGSSGLPTVPPTGGGGPIVPGAGGMCPAPGECGQPRYLTYDCKTGQFRYRSRRRRRRLLTNRDISDLAALQAIAGKGSALQMAIATAVKR